MASMARRPIGQGEQLFQALLHADCDVEFVRDPEGYHGLQRSVAPP